jgi:hypothetical protein
MAFIAEAQQFHEQIHFQFVLVEPTSIKIDAGSHRANTFMAR